MKKKISKELKEIRKHYRKTWRPKETMPKITETKDCFVYEWCMQLDLRTKTKGGRNEYPY